MINVGDEVKLGEENGVPMTGIYLGMDDGREWFWNRTKRKRQWRVPELRECICAPEGYKVLAADYSQIEVKLMAFLSEDQGLIKALNARDASGNPTDIHCYISTMVYGEKLGFTYDEMITVIKEKAPGGKKHPRYEEFKRMRSNIKTTTFGVPYGSSAKGVATRCGITEEEAQQVIDDFFKQFPRLKVWLEEQGNHALRYGYTETPYGRKRFYDVPSLTNVNTEEYDAEIQQIRRQAGNHPIQAASADMLKDALRKIYAAVRGGKTNDPPMYGARIILVLHDEIVMTCKTEHIEAVKAIMKKCMDEAYMGIIGDAIPNVVDVAVEDSWEKA